MHLHPFLILSITASYILEDICFRHLLLGHCSVLRLGLGYFYLMVIKLGIESMWSNPQSILNQKYLWNNLFLFTLLTLRGTDYVFNGLHSAIIKRAWYIALICSIVPPKIFQISRGELHLSTFNSQFSCDSLYVHSVILSKKFNLQLSIASVKP